MSEALIRPANTFPAARRILASREIAVSPSMQSSSEIAQRALNELAPHLGALDAALPEPFVRRFRRAAGRLEAVSAREMGMPDVLTSVVLDLMRALAAIDSTEASGTDPAQAARNALNFLRALPPVEVERAASGTLILPPAAQSPVPSVDALRRVAMKLGPLLRRRGTSPLTGKALRRSVEVLDAAIGPNPPTAPESAAAAVITEMSSALQLCQGAEARQGDIDLAPDLRELLGVLTTNGAQESAPTGVATTAPLPLQVVALPPNPPASEWQPPLDTSSHQPPLAPMPVSAILAAEPTRLIPTAKAKPLDPWPQTPLPPLVEPAPYSNPIASPRAPVPIQPIATTKPAVVAPRVAPSVESDKSTEAAALIRSQLASFYMQRKFFLSQIELRGRDLARLDDRIVRHIRAAEFTIFSDHDEASVADEASAFSTTVIDLIGRKEGDERALDACPPPASLPGALFALWFLPPAHVIAPSFLRSLGTEGTSMLWAARLFPAGAGTADALVDLLDDESDEVASGAAKLLAAFPASAQTLNLLMNRVTRQPGSPRADSLLFTAASWGSSQALDDVRKRLSEGPVSAPLIHALAIAGNARDAELLATVAGKGGAHAHLAALACGHLGYGRAVLSLPDGVDARVREEAIALVFGQDPPDASIEHRLLRGKSWSTASVFESLADPDEWLISRSMRAWEVRSRLGRGTSSVFEVEAPTNYQIAWLNTVRSGGRLDDAGAGRWVSPGRGR